MAMWKITMSLLTAFGLFSVTAMLVCYALESKSSWFILGFAGACTLESVYDFCRAHGPSEWSRLSGRWWQGGAGGRQYVKAGRLSAIIIANLQFTARWTEYTGLRPRNA
jgi:hypothetical protein